MARIYARRLVRGERILHRSRHHTGVAFLLGLRPEGMEVSRICSDECSLSWVGYSYNRRGEQVPYQLCIPAHYAYETQAENLARKTAA